MLDLFDTPSLMTAPTLSITSSASSFDEFSPVNSPVNNRSTSTFDANLIMSAYNNNTSNVAQLPYQEESRSDVNSRALVPVSEDQIDVITKSMKNIVNLDDINSKPFQPVSQSLVSNNTKPTSGASNWGLVGRQPTLQEQQQMKSQMTAVQQQQQQVPAQNQQPYGQAPPMQNQPYGYYANGNAQQAYTYARAY
mmetsp:Transcript_25011/g.38361  ORF Transcript_25011/g.38361 Transcript_25011/m.38361 type:complete len:194 (-) Transcript_25011:125-706(-)